MGLKDDSRAMKKEEYCESSSNNINDDDSEASSSLISSSYSYLTSSDDFADDANSSSSSTSTTSSTSSPLYELAELMAQLPIKRGLSKYYNGKSESFASLASDHLIRSVEDLEKKDYGGGCSYSKRMKSCKSYGGNLNKYKFGPKATITKRPPHQYKGLSSSFSPSLPAKTYHINAPQLHVDQPN